MTLIGPWEYFPALPGPARMVIAIWLLTCIAYLLLAMIPHNNRED